MFKQKRKRFPCEEENEISLLEVIMYSIIFILAIVGLLFLIDGRDKEIMESAQRYEECIKHQYDGMHPVEVYHLNNGVWPECDYEKTKTN